MVKNESDIQWIINRNPASQKTVTHCFIIVHKMDEIQHH